MKKITLTIAVILCLALPLFGMQQHDFYTHFNYKDGLPDAYLTSCCQDSFGRLWVGSKEGVYFYSGTDFVPLLDEDYLAFCSEHTLKIIYDNDNAIWISSNSGIGYYDILLGRFYPIKGLDDIIINDIDADDSGKIWLTSQKGVYKYDKDGGALSLEIDNEAFSPYRTCISESGILNITARNNCIYLFNPTTKAIKAIKSDRSDAAFLVIDNVSDSKVIVANGLKEVCVLDTETGKTEKIVGPDILENEAEVNSLMSFGGQCWIGTTYGLIVYDPDTEEIEIQFPDKTGSSSLGGENVRFLFSDKSGNIWACTHNGGLRCSLSYDKIKRYASKESLLTGDSIRALCEDDKGNIWSGSEDGHLCRYNPETQTFVDYTATSGIPYGTAVTNIVYYDSNLWIATYGNGILVFDPRQGKCVKKYTAASSRCMNLLVANDGALYSGSFGGFSKFDKSSDSFVNIETAEKLAIHCLADDGNGHIIIGTYGQGFSVYNLHDGSFLKNASKTNDFVTSLFVDSMGTIWATTDGNGICKVTFNESMNGLEVQRITQNDGLPSNSAGSIVEGNGQLWFATSYGLVEYSREYGKINKIYFQNDEVIGCHFDFGGSLICENGDICLGTTKGVLIFDPQYLKERFTQTPLFITDIIVGSLDKRTTVSQNNRSAITSKEIVLRQKDVPLIEITFSSMNYDDPNLEQFDCTLTKHGFISKLTTEKTAIAYASLSPGRYRFSVNFTESLNRNTEASIMLRIKAPWYSSIGAILTYLLLLGVGIFFLARFEQRKKKEENQRRLELMDAQREKNLAHEKMNFFTNIAHEIRTPVSVILILLEKLTAEQKFSDEVDEDLKSIQLNAEKLRKECNELLDFRKIENGQARLVLVNEDIRSIANTAIASFQSAANIKGINISTSIPQHPILVNCDVDAVNSIFCNLISNAIKYSTSEISISIDENQEKAIFRVNSNGTRIPEDENEKIFEAFFQSKSTETAGTGLGLTYSRQLANLHKGRLFLDTSVKEFNSFVLELPKPDSSCQESDSFVAANDMDEPDDTGVNQDKEKQVVLIVEDNSMMRDVLRNKLSKTYDIITACDGKEALSIVKEGKIDLVVSDIMMPNMDGCELCNAIKENIQLSHIPVLLMTAAVGVETHIKSLKSGADAYIEKPFKMEMLLAHISNLFRNRDIRNEQFINSPLSHISFSSISKVEREFMDSLHEFILDNISETELTLGRLANVMSISKSTLSRKVKANTGLTVNEYVRLCRLKKAMEILKNDNCRINEVAYLVGYSSPSYFTQSFQKQFGELPSEFLRKGMGQD